ncbi:MAG: TIGR03085 family metal-binding protein [Actinomycetota bacterium]|nr:TIGR03085 family metal-binding protein [Actinomycetota bacterium]
MTNYAQTERHALADLFDKVGPDAPTLCGDWSTADLAAHLVVRERRPDGAVGIVVPPLAGYAEKVRLGTRDANRWADLVNRVRSGPPVFLRPLDASVNTVEYLVHHEDVRRAGADWAPRTLDPAEEAVLWKRLGLLGRVLLRGAPVGVELVSPGHGRSQPKSGDLSVTVTGPPSELLLFAFGRQTRSHVTVDGDELSVERVRTASLGL